MAKVYKESRKFVHRCCEIFESLAETGEDFTTANAKVIEYFIPKKNVEYETPWVSPVVLVP